MNALQSYYSRDGNHAARREQVDGTITFVSRFRHGETVGWHRVLVLVIVFGVYEACTLVIVENTGSGRWVSSARRDGRCE